MPEPRVGIGPFSMDLGVRPLRGIRLDADRGLGLQLRPQAVTFRLATHLREIKDKRRKRGSCADAILRLLDEPLADPHAR